MIGFKRKHSFIKHKERFKQLKIQTDFIIGIHLLSNIVQSPLHYDLNTFNAYSLLHPQSNEGSN